MKTVYARKSNTLTYAGWGVIWCLILYFLYSNALRYLSPDFQSTPEFSPFYPFLVLHIVLGMTALLIGPFQFSSAIRARHPNIHRTMGKIYLLAVLISATVSIYLSVNVRIILNGNFDSGVGLLGLAAAWLITSGMAFFAIRNRNFQQHKEWMIRSYVVTNGFVTFRIIYYTLHGIEGFPYKKGDDISDVSSWACWAFPLLITEWILQAKKIKQPVSLNTKRTVSSQPIDAEVNIG